MSIFGLPACGWSYMKIGEFGLSASYITDIPNDCLEAMVYALENGTDFICNFDAESNGNFKVISDDYRTYVIEESSEQLYICESINKQVLSQEMYKAFSNKAWKNWQFDQYEDPFEYDLYNKELNANLHKLEIEYEKVFSISIKSKNINCKTLNSNFEKGTSTEIEK